WKNFFKRRKNPFEFTFLIFFFAEQSSKSKLYITYYTVKKEELKRKKKEKRRKHLHGVGIDEILGMTWTKTNRSARSMRFSTAHLTARRLPLPPLPPEPP
ncbi:hypothetical protein PanWU01x14_371160, partial [Parasponia andersonii]